MSDKPEKMNCPICGLYTYRKNIEHNERIYRASQWIPVSERLPKYDGHFVLVYMPHNRCSEIAYRDNGKWVSWVSAADNREIQHYISHWMEIPEPPK